MARQSKLTPARQALAVEAIEAGVTYADAAACAGIAESTWHMWMKRSPAFREAIAAASARVELRCLQIINEAMVKDWRAAAWFLERRFPERWGNRQQVDVAHGGEIVFRVVDDWRGSAIEAAAE